MLAEADPPTGIAASEQPGRVLEQGQEEVNATNVKMELTKKPVTPLARATVAPEPLSSLTWCSVASQ